MNSVAVVISLAVMVTIASGLGYKSYDSYSSYPKGGGNVWNSWGSRGGRNFNTGGWDLINHGGSKFINYKIFVHDFFM